MKKIIEQSLKCEVVSRGISSLPVIKHLVTKFTYSIIQQNFFCKMHTIDYMGVGSIINHQQIK